MSARTPRDELIDTLEACAREIDREKGQSLAEDALLDYIADQQVTDSYREAQRWHNQYNPDPRRLP
jgi:hypothetical protein